MAYTFGARLDDDSFALTYVDEDQGTAITKGEINGVPFESGGGGGSSDFSTATVTATYTLPEGVESLEGCVFDNGSDISVVNENNNRAIQFTYGTFGLPLSELGAIENIKVPLYKEYSSDINQIYYEIPDFGYLMIDLLACSVISGDAVVDTDNGVLLVNGDCSLNLTLMEIP